MEANTFPYLIFLILCFNVAWCQITDIQCSPSDAPPRCYALTEDRLDFQSAEEACQAIQMSGSSSSYLVGDLKHITIVDVKCYVIAG